MINFKIQAGIDIPASQQLLDQIRFAIASRQFPPGKRLPSTRQLAQQTGLHRNTISKVYQQLEAIGLVESLAGSGIYVKAQGHEEGTKLTSPLLDQHPAAKTVIKQSIDQLLNQGYTLEQVKELILAEIDWRSRCNALVLVTVPEADLGAGKLMVLELAQALSIPVELVPMEQLNQVLDNAPSVTVVTSRYFVREVLAQVAPQSMRVIPVDIYDYSKELKLIKKLPANSTLGIVSLSVGILRVAEIIAHSLRGSDLLITTAQVNDQYKLKNLVRSCHTIICDQSSFVMVKKMAISTREDVIRPPQIIQTESYVGIKSINLLKRELGINQ